MKGRFRSSRGGLGVQEGGSGVEWKLQESHGKFRSFREGSGVPGEVLKFQGRFRSSRSSRGSLGVKGVVQELKEVYELKLGGVEV